AVGEAVVAVVVGVGHVGKAALGVEDQTAMSDVAHEPGGQDVAIHIGVVAQDAGNGNGQRHVFERGVGIVDRNGIVANRHDVDGDGGDVSGNHAVVGTVAEAFVAVVV